MKEYKSSSSAAQSNEKTSFSTGSIIFATYSAAVVGAAFFLGKDEYVKRNKLINDYKDKVDNFFKLNFFSFNTDSLAYFKTNNGVLPEDNFQSRVYGVIKYTFEELKNPIELAKNKVFFTQAATSVDLLQYTANYISNLHKVAHDSYGSSLINNLRIDLAAVKDSSDSIQGYLTALADDICIAQSNIETIAMESIGLIVAGGICTYFAEMYNII